MRAHRSSPAASAVVNAPTNTVANPAAGARERPLEPDGSPIAPAGTACLATTRIALGECSRSGAALRCHACPHVRGDRRQRRTGCADQWDNGGCEAPPRPRPALRLPWRPHPPSGKRWRNGSTPMELSAGTQQLACNRATPRAASYCPAAGVNASRPCLQHARSKTRSSSWARPTAAAQARGMVVRRIIQATRVPAAALSQRAAAPPQPKHSRDELRLPPPEQPRGRARSRHSDAIRS
jgi:hypothetical protein